MVKSIESPAEIVSILPCGVVLVTVYTTRETDSPESPAELTALGLQIGNSRNPERLTFKESVIEPFGKMGWGADVACPK